MADSRPAFCVRPDVEWWWADTIGAADPPKIVRVAENLTTTKSVGVWGRSPRNKEATMTLPPAVAGVASCHMSSLSTLRRTCPGDPTDDPHRPRRRRAVVLADILVHG